MLLFVSIIFQSTIKIKRSNNNINFWDLFKKMWKTYTEILQEFLGAMINFGSFVDKYAKDRFVFIFLLIDLKRKLR